ncbi:uncharacterized protein LOC135942986 [Cloeon dipterum]|uniref:uncharacterized protein LOC135942986 n=1 Tax=Cloeon dipterum TaxID=197152 RepID=UPI0032205FB1
MSISVPDCRKFPALEFTTTPQDWLQIRKSGEVCKDESNVQFLHMPKSKKVRIDINKEHPDDEIDACAENEGPWNSKLDSYFSSQNERFQDAEFVFDSDWTLTDVLKLPFMFDSVSEHFQKIRYRISKSNGKIYIRGFINESTSSGYGYRPERKISDKLRFMYSFLSSSRDIEPDVSSPIKNQETRTLVTYYSALGEHKMFYPASVDGFDKDVDLESIKGDTIAQLKFFRKKDGSYVGWRSSLNYWAKLMVAQGKLIAGYYNIQLNDGIVKSWKILDAEQLYKNVESSWEFYEKTPPPSKFLGINFLNDFLSFLKTELQDAKANEVYEFEFDASDPAREGKLSLFEYTSEVPAWFDFRSL